MPSWGTGGVRGTRSGPVRPCMTGLIAKLRCTRVLRQAKAVTHRKTLSPPLLLDLVMRFPFNTVRFVRASQIGRGAISLDYQ